MPITVADIKREVKEKNVTFIRLMFSDILGTMKNVEIPATDEQFLFGLTNRICIYIQIWTLGLFSLGEMKMVALQD